VLYPSATLCWERVEMPHHTAVAIHRTLFDAHNPAAVQEPKQVVHEMDKGDHAAPSLPFPENMMMGHPPGTSPTGSSYSTQTTKFHISSHGIPASQYQAAFGLFLANDFPVQLTSCH
jgi:hypothetical protein